MPAAKIRKAIKDDPEFQQLAIIGDDTTLASLIEIRDVREYRLTSAGVLDLFGPIRGQVVMSNLRAVKDFSEIVRIMDGSGVNLAHKDADVVYGALVTAGIITAEESQQIKQLAIVKVNPSVSDVSKALKAWRPGGTVNQLEMENV